MFMCKSSQSLMSLVYIHLMGLLERMKLLKNKGNNELKFSEMLLKIKLMAKRLCQEVATNMRDTC